MVWRFSFNHYFNAYKTRIFIAIGFVVLLILLRYVGISNYVSLEAIKANAVYIKNFISYNYALSVFIYIIILMLASFFSIPITVILNLVAGFFYGAIVGALYVNIGVTLGATLSFFAFRYLLGSFVQDRYAEKLKNFNKNIEKNGYSYLLSLQLFPATPTMLINICSGLTLLKPWTFIWTTSLGILPGSLIYTFAGQQLSKIENTRAILSWPIIIVFIMLAFASLLPVLLHRFFNNKKPVL